MLTIENVGKNETIVNLDAVQLFFSYNTVVACHSWVDGKTYVTDEFHSVTTSRHINKYVASYSSGNVEKVSADRLDHIAATG